MAKRRLSGAALAAYNKKRGIGSGGGSRSIARRGSTSVVVVRPSAPAKKKRRRGRRRGGGGDGGGGIAGLKAQLPDFMGAAGYGFLTGDHNAAPSITSMVKKIPILDAIGAPASHGLILHFGKGFLPAGFFRRAASKLSKAALMHAFHNLGITGGDYAKAATLSGDPDYLEGDMDVHDD